MVSSHDKNKRRLFPSTLQLNLCLYQRIGSFLAGMSSPGNAVGSMVGFRPCGLPQPGKSWNKKQKKRICSWSNTTNVYSNCAFAIAFFQVYCANIMLTMLFPNPRGDGRCCVCLDILAGSTQVDATATDDRPRR